MRTIFETRGAGNHRSSVKLLLVALIASAPVLLRPTPSEALSPTGRSTTRPANTLVMPFDATSVAQTSLSASNLGVSPAAGGFVAGVVTHWVYYSQSSDPLAEAWVCLVLGGSVVVSPSRVVSLDAGGAEFGPIVDLTGTRGLVVVTAYEADEVCNPRDLFIDDAISGDYSISYRDEQLTISNGAFGFGLNATGTSPSLRVDDYSDEFFSSSINALSFPLYNPEDLTTARLILLKLTSFPLGEIAPGAATTRYSVGFIDNLGIQTLLPPLTVSGASFRSVFAGGDTAGIIPPTVSILSSGVLLFDDPSPDSPDDLVLGVLGQSLIGETTSSLEGIVCPGDFFCPGLSDPIGVLELPADGGNASGIGQISGWVCNASRVYARIDGGPAIPAAYGTPRVDTTSVCGDADNGFAILYNWNLLGDGEHTVDLYQDGYFVDRSTFQVTTLGQKFVRGTEPTCQVPNIAGRRVTLQFKEASQGAVIVDAPPAP